MLKVSTEKEQELINPAKTAEPHLWLGFCPVITCRPVKLESCWNPELQKQEVSLASIWKTPGNFGFKPVVPNRGGMSSWEEFPLYI